MVDTFGKEFEGLRNTLSELGYADNIILATSQTGTTDGFLYLNGRTTETDGIPVPEGCTMLVEMYFATYLDASTDAHEAGRIVFGAYRRGSGNTTVLDIVGASGNETVFFAETAGDTALSVTVVPSANTTNQALRITIDQASGTDTAYVIARAKVICAINGLARPLYEG